MTGNYHKKFLLYGTIFLKYYVPECYCMLMKAFSRCTISLIDAGSEENTEEISGRSLRLNASVLLLVLFLLLYSSSSSLLSSCSLLFSSSSHLFLIFLFLFPFTCALGAIFVRIEDTVHPVPNIWLKIG